MQISEQLHQCIPISEPKRRAGSSMEAAEVIAFLLSPAASFVNGAVYAEDGGSLVANSGMTYVDGLNTE